jgi:glycosyltransferase involved in cell wall biosynthesis
MIYAGAFTFEPNFRAMQWFVDKVLPRIVAQVPQAHLTITGNHAGRTLSMPGYVSLTGYVDDVHSRIARSWCSVVPLLQGGGTRLKILEAMALGTPVIATSKGAEGLDVQPGEHLLVADEPHAFAEAVLNLFVDPLLRQRLAANAHQLIREKYDWAVTMPRFLKMIESVVG